MAEVFCVITVCTAVVICFRGFFSMGNDSLSCTVGEYSTRLPASFSRVRTTHFISLFSSTSSIPDLLEGDLCVSDASDCNRS